MIDAQEFAEAAATRLTLVGADEIPDAELRGVGLDPTVETLLTVRWRLSPGANSYKRTENVALFSVDESYLASIGIHSPAAFADAVVDRIREASGRRRAPGQSQQPVLGRGEATVIARALVPSESELWAEFLEELASTGSLTPRPSRGLDFVHGRDRSHRRIEITPQTWREYILEPEILSLIRGFVPPLMTRAPSYVWDELVELMASSAMISVIEGKLVGVRSESTMGAGGGGDVARQQLRGTWRSIPENEPMPPEGHQPRP